MSRSPGGEDHHYTGMTAGRRGILPLITNSFYSSTCIFKNPRKTRGRDANPPAVHSQVCTRNSTLRFAALGETFSPPGDLLPSSEIMFPWSTVPKALDLCCCLEPPAWRLILDSPQRKCAQGTTGPGPVNGSIRGEHDNRDGATSGF